MLLIAAIYAGTTHSQSIPLVITAAASGAIMAVWSLPTRSGGRNTLLLHKPHRSCKL